MGSMWGPGVGVSGRLPGGGLSWGKHGENGRYEIPAGACLSLRPLFYLSFLARDGRSLYLSCTDPVVLGVFLDSEVVYRWLGVSFPHEPAALACSIYPAEGGRLYRMLTEYRRG